MSDMSALSCNASDIALSEALTTLSAVGSPFTFSMSSSGIWLASITLLASVASSSSHMASTSRPPPPADGDSPDTGASLTLREYTLLPEVEGMKRLPPTRKSPMA